MSRKFCPSSLRDDIAFGLSECRQKTLELFAGMDDCTFRSQSHPDFSPVGWHLGHIAYTESLWLLEHSAGLPCLFPQYRRLFAADGLPKSERVAVPGLEVILDYLDTVRGGVLKHLESVDIVREERLWRFLIQHECQHWEIISFIGELLKWQRGDYSQYYYGAMAPLDGEPMIEIPAGEFLQGQSSPEAMDNEIPVQKVYLNTYYIDSYPVTCEHYGLFMQAGGYKNPNWWSKEGWQWLQSTDIIEPLYWRGDSSWNHHPVCGVSWYEAEAYTRFVGKRLPTEAEWEKAAAWDGVGNYHRVYAWENQLPIGKNCNCDRLIGHTTPVNAYANGKSAYGLYDTLGNVWEWTGSWFDGYKGFESYPYIGYSKVYFDQQHRVLKGGSWATRPWALRCSFRNWYHPHMRQMFVGFRCAAD